MIVMINYAMGVRDYMSLFMLVCCCWVLVKMVN